MSNVFYSRFCCKLYITHYAHDVLLLTQQVYVRR